jgi:hypothetical protein
MRTVLVALERVAQEKAGQRPKRQRREPLSFSVLRSALRGPGIIVTESEYQKGVLKTSTANKKGLRAVPEKIIIS